MSSLILVGKSKKEKRGEFHLAFAMYRSKYAVFCQKNFLKTVPKP